MFGLITVDARARRRRSGRIATPLQPDRVIGSYYAKLAPLADQFVALAAREYLSHVDEIFADLGGRTDAPADGGSLLNEIARSLTLRWQRTVTLTKAQQIANIVDGQVQGHTERQVKRVVKSVIGVDPLLKSPKLLRQSRAFTRANSRLIVTLGPDHLNRVNRAVRKAIRSGQRVETLTKTIEGYFAKSAGGKPKNIHAAARLIARDQVLKHNADLTRERHKAIGIAKYTWRTSRDERVRDSHDALDGQVFEYGKSPIGLDPGEDYQCRCHAEPVIEGDIFAELLAA